MTTPTPTLTLAQYQADPATAHALAQQHGYVTLLREDGTAWGQIVIPGAVQCDEARCVEARTKLANALEALRPLACALDGWPYDHRGRDIGRLNYDTGITAEDVERARRVLEES